MSATAHASEGHGHEAGHETGHAGGHGKDHVPHVLPLPVYLGVFAMLIVFTVITVGVSYIDVGQTLNLVIALGVATMKATMVGLIFMHLAFDKKFNAIVFAMSLVFLGIFIGLTLYDTEYRALGGRVTGVRAADISSPFDGPNPFTKEDAALKARAAAQPIAEEPGTAAPAPAAPAPAPAAPAVAPEAAPAPH